MTALSTALIWLTVFASLHCVQSRPSELERAGRLVRDGKAVSANDLSLEDYHRLMTGGSQQRREGGADADAGNVPTAADLMGGASKGLRLDELWKGYKECADEYEAEEEWKAINNTTEALVNMASEVVTAGVPLGDGSQASAVVKSTFDFARNTASYAKTKCIPETRLVKRSVQESVQMLNKSLTNRAELKKNAEHLMKTLDVPDGNIDELRSKMDLALKQLAVIEGKVGVLDSRAAQLAEQMSRSYEDLKNFYQQNFSGHNYELLMINYRKEIVTSRPPPRATNAVTLAIRVPLVPVHELVLRFISFNSTNEISFRQKHQEIVEQCKQTNAHRILTTMSTTYFAPDSLNRECGPEQRFPIPLLLEAFKTDLVQSSMFFYQVAADFLIAITVMSECDGAVGVRKKAAEDDLAAAQLKITEVLTAFRQAFRCYQKEYLTMWDERTVPTPLNYIPLVVGQFKQAVSQPHADPAEAADVRRTKLFAFRSFLAYTPEGPNVNPQGGGGYMDKRDYVAGADYSTNWGFIVNRFDTNKSKRDLAVVYAGNCTYDGIDLGWAQGWGCNAAIGYGFPLNGSEDNIIYKPHRVAKKCYNNVAKKIGTFWTREYGNSTEPKWQFTQDTFYSRIPDIFAEIESRDPKLLKGFMDEDFKCSNGAAPPFLPMAVHYGISYSYVQWLPTKNTTYFYADRGESVFWTSRGKDYYFYFHAIVYY